MRDKISQNVLLYLQVMVPCPHFLPTTTTQPLVEPVTLRLAAGDQTAGHLVMELLRLLQLDPQQLQSPQLPLATAGIHGVPKDEWGLGIM